MGKTVLRGLIESFIEAKASWDSIFLKNLEHEVESSDIKKDVYKKCLNAYICINHTARAISQIPLQVEKKRKDKWVPIEDHPWSDLLRKPNNHMSEIDFKQSLFSFLMLDGQVGIVPLPLGDPNPIELMVVRKKYFKPKVNDKGRLEYWEYSPNPTSYKSIPIYPEEMISTWFVDPDNPYIGLAPSEVGDLEILTDYKSAYYNQQFFDEGAIPGGILYTDRTLGDKSFGRTREQFVGRHQSYKRSHRIAVLDQGLKYQQLSMNLKDMDFINLKKYTREQIFQIYGMKPAVLGVTKDVNRATHKEEMKSWWRDTCLPLMKMISSEFTFYLSMGTQPTKNKIRVSWDMAAIEAIHEDYSQKVSTGWKLHQMGIPINQINQKLELGFSDIEGGDEGYIPSSMVPMSSFNTEDEEKPKPKPEEEPEENPEDDEEEEEEKPNSDEEKLSLEEEVLYKKLKRILYNLRKKFIKSLYSDEFKQFNELDLTNEKKKCIILLIEVYSNILKFNNPKQRAEKLSNIIDIVQSSINKNFINFEDKDLVATNMKKFFNSFNKKLKKIVKLECSNRGN